MSDFRFFHAADIHLDSPLKGLAGLDDHTANRIRTATRQALRNLVTRAIDEQVDFVVIAGDLYDGDWRDFNTGLYFVREMGRLNEAGIPVFLLHGNHDAESQITRQLPLPENVQVFPSRNPQTIELEKLPVALHGQSFARAAVTENLALGYPSPVPGRFNIGVLHTALGGSEGHENYAPCSRDDLIARQYDYWALGHVHGAAILHEHPHIVFPGNLQGRHIRETGAKGASLVTVNDLRVVAIDAVHCDVVRWHLVPVDVSGATTFDEILARVREGLADCVDGQAADQMSACRLQIQGTTTVHEQLLRSQDQLLADARSIALGLGDERAWVEKVKVVTTSPPAASDRFDELDRVIRQNRHDEALLTALRSDLGELARVLPEEVRTAVDDDLLAAVIRAGDEAGFAALVDDIWPILAARLNPVET